MLTLFTECIHECICDAGNLQALKAHIHTRSDDMSKNPNLRECYESFGECVCMHGTSKKADRPTTIAENCLVIHTSISYI